MKVCTHCLVEKPAEDFAMNGHRDRPNRCRRSRCKECERRLARRTPNKPKDGRRGPVDAVRMPDGTIELIRRGAA